jgi:hypothetical protein
MSVAAIADRPHDDALIAALEQVFIPNCETKE